MGRTIMGESMTLAEARLIAQAQRDKDRLEARTQALQEVLKVIEAEQTKKWGGWDSNIYILGADNLRAKIEEMLNER